ncbi:YbhB/YbcL family Raf kinase inhibitor-like protein [Rubrivivax gelatinosus]|uniref:Phosphatidylethanolamine-binding protein n=1 Tax=Rubrivivax gelatinosus TaxID=28068 RepID=A0ABS1DP66_RUBGE|nr:YbhB/YbcL family Raf kinase inhibitor-like protein [Rubrivivax gelatinosus]MBK1711370.1 phosphatidylethanolamine-binding protein [Rubrivivax gelatinosus]
MLEKLPDTLGHALHGMRAGRDKTLFHAIDLRAGMGAIRLESLAFGDHAPIPALYTADGTGISPPLHWSGVPAAAVELVLIVEDADSPSPQPLVHAIAHALPADAAGALAEGALGGGNSAPAVATGLNSLLQSAWLAPDPPPGHGLHHYLFQVFALEAGEGLGSTPGRDALRQAVLARGLASGCLVGCYERRDGSITEGAAGPVGAARIA